MDKQQVHQEGRDRNKLDATGRASEGELSLDPSEGLYVPILEPRMSQAPMNLARDYPRDDMGINTVSNSKAITNSAWSCESMRDTHEFIREVNGRQYNAQNNIYFLPAGGSSNSPAYPPPNSHKCAIYHHIPSSYA